MKKLSPTALRHNLFKVIDEVIKTGVPAEIERKGHTLKIIVDEKRDKLANLKQHHAIVGDPEELVSLKVGEWSEEKNR